MSDYLTNLIGQQRPKNTVPVPTATPAPKLLPNSLQDAGNELLGNLGIAGRGLVQGAVSPITMVADPLTEFVNKTFGAKEKLPSQAVSEGLTALGVPQAKDDAQRILEAATGGLAGGGAIAKTAQLAGKGAGLAKGYLDTIGKDLAGQMTSGLGSGAASVGASQAATASGASPVVAQLAGLGGGIVGGGARPVTPNKALGPAGTQAFQSAAMSADALDRQITGAGAKIMTDSGSVYQKTGNQWIRISDMYSRARPEIADKFDDILAQHLKTGNPKIGNYSVALPDSELPKYVSKPDTYVPDTGSLAHQREVDRALASMGIKLPNGQPDRMPGYPMPKRP